MRKLRRSLDLARAEPTFLALREAALLYGITLSWLAAWTILAPESKRHLFFKEGGPIDWLSSSLLLTAALVAWSVWIHRPRGETASWFWAISATGLLFLAFDERFQFHESSRLILTPLFGIPPQGVKNWNDAAVMGYGVVALIVFGLALPAVVRHRGTRNYLALAIAFYAAHTIADTMPRSTLQVTCEESSKLMANTSLLLAFLEALRARMHTAAAAVRIGKRRVAFVVILAIALAAMMLSGDQAWREALRDKWGLPTAWLQSACLAGTAILTLLVSARSVPKIPGEARLFWALAGITTGWLGFGLSARACLESFTDRLAREQLPSFLRVSYGPFHDLFSLSGGIALLSAGTLVVLAVRNRRRPEGSESLRWLATGVALCLATATLGALWLGMPYAAMEQGLVIGCALMALGALTQLADPTEFTRE